MKIRTDLPDNFYGKGFTPETDPFGKSDLAERLTALYGNLAQGTVSILDGRWGIGKSVFARQWQHQLQTRGIPCIYFDAFAADYVESPFRAVASTFVRAAKEAKSHDDARYDHFLTVAAKALKIVAAPIVKMAVKAGTLGLVGSSEIDGLKTAADDVASGFSDISEEAVKAMLEGQAGDEASFAELRKSLADLPELLAKKLDAEKGHVDEDIETGSRSLVVIIDELDRCRPDFALGVMEVLKHFFRAERVHFVLVTNLNHLLLSVQKRYGVGDAAGEYLQKFYDFIIPFEGQQLESHITSAGLHAQRLLKKMLVDANTQTGSNLVQNVVEIVNAFDLSLRQAERIVINVVLAQIDFSKNVYLPFQIVFLAVLKAVEPAKFADIKKSRLNTEFLQQFVKEGKWSSPSYGERLLRAVRYYSDPAINIQDQEYKGFGDGWSFNFDSRLDILPHLANNVIDRFG